MAKSKRRMEDFSDPRTHIVAAYKNLSKPEFQGRTAEFETALNNVNGPDAAIRLARKYANLKPGE